MKNQKNLFIIMVILTFLVSIFSSVIVYKTLEYNDASISNDSDSKSNKVSYLDEKAAQKSISNIKDLQTSVKSIARKISPSVVSIVISKDVPNYISDPYWFFQEPTWSVTRQKIWWWTWFFVNNKGIILTNKHVVWDPNAEYSIITSNNKEYVWKILAIDPTTDLAVVKAYTKDWKELTDTPSVTFSADAKDIEVGDFVVAIWNALAEFQNTVTFWVISWLDRSIEAWSQNWLWSELLTWLLQTDTAINPWNSWGPLVNLDSKVVWINTAIAAWANWLGFSIPLSQKEVNYILSSIEKYWKIKRAFLWIRYISLSESNAKTLWIKQTTGDYIWSSWNAEAVVKWSPADIAWLKAWDIILEINSIELKNWISTKDVLKWKIPEETVKMKVLTKDWITKIVNVVLWTN